MICLLFSPGGKKLPWGCSQRWNKSKTQAGGRSSLLCLWRQSARPQLWQSAKDSHFLWGLFEYTVDRLLPEQRTWVLTLPLPAGGAWDICLHRSQLSLGVITWAIMQSLLQLPYCRGHIKSHKCECILKGKLHVHRLSIIIHLTTSVRSVRDLTPHRELCLARSLITLPAVTSNGIVICTWLPHLHHHLCLIIKASVIEFSSKINWAALALPLLIDNRNQGFWILLIWLTQDSYLERNKYKQYPDLRFVLLTFIVRLCLQTFWPMTFAVSSCSMVRALVWGQTDQSEAQSRFFCCLAVYVV